MDQLSSLLKVIIPLTTALLFRQFEYTKLSLRDQWDKEYDFIVIGAGSAGAVVASRLSEIKQFNVLLIEAGGAESVLTEIPGFDVKLLKTAVDWNYSIVPQKNCCTGIDPQKWGVVNMPRGKALGGTSAINDMIYVRGNKHDYDSWVSDGTVDWSYESVLKLFKKSENIDDQELASGKYHSEGGYLSVRSKFELHPFTNAFIKAGVELGYRDTDINGEHQIGFSSTHKNIQNGSRCSTGKAFLIPAGDRPNLHILSDSTVKKILFDKNSIAIGVEFDRKGSLNTVYTRKEIILSAGPISSPQILMLSGIGPKKHLESMEIPVLADLPVGFNLQDHMVISFSFSTTNLNKTFISMSQLLDSYFNERKGPLTSNIIEATAFINTGYSNRVKDWPDIQFVLLPRVYGNEKSNAGLTILVILIAPQSKGTIQLKSKDYKDYPFIDPMYLSHSNDKKVFSKGVQFIEKLLATDALKKLNLTLVSNQHPLCDIYIVWSEKYAECVVSKYAGLTSHLAGTCKMGTRTDKSAVVDENLRVLGGINGLRVIDSSIMPTVTSGNTNAPSIMIGEMGSKLIKNDYFN